MEAERGEEGVRSVLSLAPAGPGPQASLFAHVSNEMQRYSSHVDEHVTAHVTAELERHMVALTAFVAAELQRQVAALAEQVGGQTGEASTYVAGELQRQAAAISAYGAGESQRQAGLIAESVGREMQRQAGLIAESVGQEMQRQVGLLGEAVQRMGAQVDAHVSAHVDAALMAQRLRQNPAMSRDTLPHGAAVKQYWLQLLGAPGGLGFDEVGLGVFSQNNEDGILLYILSRVGMATKRCIEIGCDLSGSSVGVPEGNTMNLVVNFGYDGLIVEADSAKVGGIRHFFATGLSTRHYHRPAMGGPAAGGQEAGAFSPAVVAREVFPENVDAVFGEAGFTGEVDVLSVDVDGADSAIWRAVTGVSPRVVVVEVNNRLPFDTVRHGAANASTAAPESLEFQQGHGSSLAAMCEVAGEKGYVFVGMNATLINAFFVRRDVWSEALPERRPGEYVGHRMDPMRVRVP